MPQRAHDPKPGGLAANEAERLVNRATRIGGVAIALFERDGETEGKTIVSCGACAQACKHVGKLPWGKQACRRSRERALAISLRIGRPAPYVCHMGFACAAHAVANDRGDAEYALAIGPYCPTEAPGSLEQDALAGLQALVTDPVEELPFPLDDIPEASAGSTPDLLAWLAESLPWTSEADAPTEDSPHSPESTRRAKTRSGPYDPYQAATLASALAGGNQDQARDIVYSVMTETAHGKRVSLSLKRARAITLVGAVLEAADRARLDTSACWDKLDDFNLAVSRSKSVRDLVLGVMKVLGALKRQVQKSPDDAAFYHKLNRIVSQRIADDFTLSEVAKLLGLHPTAITHRLQRKFGMSFSEYRARMRIDLAKPLLRDTHLKVREIAKRVGINDTANFGKTFRKFERMSPLEYRDRYAKKGGKSPR